MEGFVIVIFVTITNHSIGWSGAKESNFAYHSTTIEGIRGLPLSTYAALELLISKVPVAKICDVAP